LPIILYDVPTRTACSLADEPVARLAEMSQFIGLKDATGDVTRPARLRRILRPDLGLLSGDDATALAFLAQGGNGCISVTFNVAPGLCRSMFLACEQGQICRSTMAGKFNRATDLCTVSQAQSRPTQIRPEPP
jgi:4-hydroxy-tetrahydrodipicolinate synthase